MTENKTKELAIGLLLVMLSGFISYYIWATTYPYNPIRMEKIIMSKTVMHPGECGTYQFSGEKLMDLPVDVTVNITNGANILLMTYTSHNPVGTKFVPRRFTLPHNLHSGRYRIMWEGIYSINGLRSVNKRYYSEWITVVR